RPRSPPHALAVRFRARRCRLAREIRVRVAETAIARDHLTAAALEVLVDACLRQVAGADGLDRAPRRVPIQGMTRAAGADRENSACRDGEPVLPHGRSPVLLCRCNVGSAAQYRTRLRSLRSGAAAAGRDRYGLVVQKPRLPAMTSRLQLSQSLK